VGGEFCHTGEVIAHGHVHSDVDVYQPAGCMHMVVQLYIWYMYAETHAEVY